MPEWCKGLIKRKWNYLVVVIVPLAIFGDGYLKPLSIPRNKEKPTFEELAVRINKRDTIFDTCLAGHRGKIAGCDSVQGSPLGILSTCRSGSLPFFICRVLACFSFSAAVAGG